MMKRILTILCLSMVILATGCATDDPNKRSKMGAVIGAVVGGVAGHQVDGKKGKYIGAVAGAIGGAAVGNYMDKQQAELKKELAAEAARNELQIIELPGNALKIGLASEVSFDVDKFAIKDSALPTYQKIGRILSSYDKTIIHVVGHTDSSGADQYNQTLSERRASAVGNELIHQSVDGSRIRLEGRGEREPVADNGTAAGRTKNRRVDIVIKPIVEGQEHEAYSPPPYLGS